MEVEYMEELSKIESRVNRIEYDEMKSMKEDISNIKIDLTKNNILTQQSIDTSRNVAETMDAVKLAMFEISESVRNSNRISTELTESVKDLNSKFENMEDKIDTRFEEVDVKFQKQDDKTKIDWVRCFSEGGWKRALEWIVLLGIISYEVLGKVGV